LVTDASDVQKTVPEDKFALNGYSHLS
jgi:hypothetical protein